MKLRYGAALAFLLIGMPLAAESFRTVVAGNLDVNVDEADGQTLSLSYIESAVVELGNGARFLRGVELDLKVPKAYLKYRGSIAVAIYTNLNKIPKPGVADVKAARAGFELLPNKLQAVYQLPIRADADMKASPYVSVPTDTLDPASFPILVRVMPVVKGLSDEIETLSFKLTAKPIIADEGAVRVELKYPEQLKDKPFTMLVDDNVVDDPVKEMILKEGEHHLAIVSDDYRNESRRFVIERGKVLILPVDLQDPTPLIGFEGPENAMVLFDGEKVADYRTPFPTTPGEHEIRFQVGDYSIVKRISIRKGRSYRVALTIDVTVTEKE